MQAYGRWLSRNASKNDALKVYADFAKELPNHPLIDEEMKRIGDGEKLPPLVDTPQAGAAEALYGLGASIGRRGGEDLALIYLQLALYLEPNHAMALLSLGDLYEDLKKPELAIKAYERVPGSSPLSRNAQIQMAVDLDTLGRTDESKKLLDKVVADHPKDTQAIIELGNVQRGHKDFADCAKTYSKAIDTLQNPREVELGDVLFPRHLLRALAPMAARRSRHEEGACSSTPISHWCSIISAIRGSTRASISIKAWT